MTRLILLLAALAHPAAAQEALTIVAPDETMKLSPRDVRDAEATVDVGGRPGVFVALGRSAALRFGRITERNVGSVLSLERCGAVLSAPVVQTPIHGGGLLITGSMTVDGAEALAAAIGEGRPCGG